VLIAALSFARAEEHTDKFAEYFEGFAKGPGPPYRNCGRVPIGGDRTQADACVLRSFEAGEAFFVRYDKLGYDSNVAEGLVLSRGKQLTVVHFDDWMCRTPYCAHPQPCNEARITKTEDGLHIVCKNEYDL
jgi:hypothetical protein